MKHPAVISTALLVATAIGAFAANNGEAGIPLTSHGNQLLEKHTKDLESLRTEVKAALPAVDEARKARFLEIRAKWNAVPQNGKETPPAEAKANEDLAAQLQTETMEAAGELLETLKPFLSSDALDSKLMRIAILTHATPRGLAEFAQQGKDQEKLLETLFADEALMRQVLGAGGANGGEYGEMMEVYTAILAKSERARERGGIFQRLALGTAIQMPWLKGKPESGIHGVVHADSDGIDQVSRYLHYEKAFLDGELDPAFKDMNTWECRFITNSEYSDEDLAWTRRMMRIYRPDIITMDDYQWRYVRFIKSDVPYCSTTHDPSLGTRPQMETALGGICGRRAFLGRLTTRAFGIPTRRSTQTGHAALSHWTPDGWVVCLGAWWSMAWCGPQGGLDFLLDSQAREFEDDYQIVRRAQWVGDALAEEDVDLRHFGRNGGFWDGLAFVKKQLIVKAAEVKALELVGGMKLGESDELIGDEVGKEIEIPEEFTAIATGTDGSITIPAVACYSPRKSSDRILFLKSWNEGYQLHYSRLGQRPELFKYRIELPAEGEYELTCQAATVSPNVEVLVRVNRDEPLPFAMPYTKGLWETSKPVRLKLAEGRNMVSVTARSPNRGVSIRHWQLKPVK
jgi:hypothetical protein